MTSTAEATPIETDTLFSWQSLPAVLSWAYEGPTTQLFTDDYLYAWRTPAATFAYGDTAIRIKLARGVDFVAITPEQRNCSKLPADQKSHTVYYSDLGSGTVDYILCSQRAIESWSFGTKEGLQEIKNEIAFVKAHPESGDYYTGFYSPSTYSADRPFGRIMDQEPSEWSAVALQKKLDFLETLSNSELPRVFCLNPSSDCALKHFSSSHPNIYGPVKPMTKPSSEKFVLKSSRLNLFINPEFVQRDVYRASTLKILDSLTSVKVFTVSPTHENSFCIGFDSPMCAINFGNLIEADKIRVNMGEAPDTQLLLYLERFRYVLTLSKFTRDLIADYARVAARIPINTLGRKSESFARYISTQTSCLKDFTLDPSGKSFISVPLLDCVINN